MSIPTPIISKLRGKSRDLVTTEVRKSILAWNGILKVLFSFPLKKVVLNEY